MEFFLHMKCKCPLSRYDDIVLHKKRGSFALASTKDKREHKKRMQKTLPAS
jgi:hypothetical protein